MLTKKINYLLSHVQKLDGCNNIHLKVTSNFFVELYQNQFWKKES